MITSRRTSTRPSRSSTVRWPSGPILTKAVDKVRRPRAPSGKSASSAGAEYALAATGPDIESCTAVWLRATEASPGWTSSEPWEGVLDTGTEPTGLELRMTASCDEGVQAASAAANSGRMRSIAVCVGVYTSFQYANRNVKSRATARTSVLSRNETKRRQPKARQRSSPMPLQSADSSMASLCCPRASPFPEIRSGESRKIAHAA